MARRTAAFGRVQMSYMQKLSPKLDGIPEEEGGDEAEVAPAGPPVKKSRGLNLGQEPAAAIAAEGPVTCARVACLGPTLTNFKLIVCVPPVFVSLYKFHTRCIKQGYTC